MTIRPLHGRSVQRYLLRVNVYYGWVIVGACFLIGLITWGTVWSFGVFFGYIVEEFRLSHANTSIVFSLQQIVMYISAAALGFVVDRYGARRLLVVATGLVVAGLFGVNQLASFAGVLFSYGVVAASGFGILFVISYATPSQWFERRRGFATGIATAGAGVGVLAVPPIAEMLIAGVGWRGLVRFWPALRAERCRRSSFGGGDQPGDVRFRMPLLVIREAVEAIDRVGAGEKPGEG